MAHQYNDPLSTIPMDSTKVFVNDVDTFLSRIPAIIAQHLLVHEIFIGMD
ncbi:hypothetical protein V1507DRAFT_464008 [Lipomyces tetrasporus]